MQESLAMSEASLRCSFSWAGDWYACTGGPEKDSMRLDEGGYRQVRSVSIKVRTVLLPYGVGLPKKKQTIQYKKNASADPVTYRIASITDYWGAVMELNCEDPNASA